ncbi:uncharacterized protein LOC142322004 [Lycorma delicatula]|uniref:uncharacterized protein LOC142322004 n=1 Tax=Lycorma delicatula TaxID=130591 RepID=UPI003F51420C
MRCLCTKIRTHHCKVILLDEQELVQEIQDTSRGQEVLDTVFRHLNLLETAYFGLRYVDTSNQTHWLDTGKKVVKQLKGKETFTLYFGVKFYAADPCKLLEEITRYQFFLQVKQDILQGRLPVSFDLAAELGAYVVQSELGDYDPRRHSPGYVSEFRFLSNQTVELENKIAQLHKEMMGQLPSVAELNYLDKVKWLEMYGVDLHPVLGEDNVEYFLGLTPTGVIVLRNKNKVANYFWPRITKIYYKGRYFMLRVCDKNNEENTYGFETPSKPACKHLYKCCVDHHAFFRLVQVSPNPPDIIGSRYSSGRAEKFSSQREAQMRLRSPPQFTRTPSRRYQRRIVEGAQDSTKLDETPKVNKENVPPQDILKTVSIPQPVHSVANLYRGTNALPVARCDSPRSTRSAPWTTAPPSRGLYTSSPRSVRSSGTGRPLTARRSSSVESHSSNDSRSCRKHRHHRSRRGSDNESELSRCSGKSGRRHRHRSRRSSGSEHESRHHSSSSKHRRYELVDSEGQWREVQRKQAEGGSGVHQANVISSKDRPRSGYMNSGMETESEHSYHHRRKHRKHRSRSRSPSESKPRLPDELKQHLEFQLVETEGMSESQLREIPYKVIETNTAKAVRVRLSPTSKRRTHSARRAKSSCSLKEEELPSTGDSPPPPYSETPTATPTPVPAPTTAPSQQQTGQPESGQLMNNDDSASSNQLPRMLSSSTSTTAVPRSLSDSANNRPLCSALYGNPATLLGSPHHRSTDVAENSSWLNMQVDRVGAVSSRIPGLPLTGSYNSVQPGGGNNPWKQDHSNMSTPTNQSPRNLPFASMRQPTNNISGIQKSWIGPEIRGTVGLPWPAPVDSLQTQLSQNNFSTHSENLNRRPSHDSSFNYSRYPYGNACEPNRTTNPNASNADGSANIYQTNNHLNNSVLLNYPGTPTHQQRTPLRTSSNAGIDQSNGNNNNNNDSLDSLSKQHHLQQQQQLRREQNNISWNRLNGSNFQTKHNIQSTVDTPSSDCSKQKLLIGSSNSSSTSSVQSNSNMSCSRSRSTLSVTEQNSNVSSTSYQNQQQSLSSKMSTSSSSQSHLLLMNSASAGGSSVSCNSGNDLKWTNDEASSNIRQTQVPANSSTKSSWGPLYLHKSSSDVENAIKSSNTQSENEVNNNPQQQQQQQPKQQHILHEMSTEL